MKKSIKSGASDGARISEIALGLLGAIIVVAGSAIFLAKWVAAGIRGM